MNQKKQISAIIISVLCFLLLMLDPQKAIEGTISGIDRCICVIIPALFPYFVVCSYMNAWLLGFQFPGLRYLAKILHIPSGGESILLLGLIGGYPVGAQTIATAHGQGYISKRTAHILLGYCNNAGPAFIFGVTSCLFTKFSIPWLLWLIQLLSIISTGLIIPHPDAERVVIQQQHGITVVSALHQSIRNMASVCGWVVLFKILTSYTDTLMQRLPTALQVFLNGLLELSNGCINLSEIPSEPARFLLCSIFLSFGGVCVLMQTRSAVNELGLGLYIPGKLIQTLLSFIYATIIVNFVFKDRIINLYQILTAIFIIMIAVILIFQYCQKKCGNLQKDSI